MAPDGSDRAVPKGRVGDFLDHHLGQPGMPMSRTQFHLL